VSGVAGLPSGRSWDPAEITLALDPKIMYTDNIFLESYLQYAGGRATHGMQARHYYAFESDHRMRKRFVQWFLLVMLSLSSAVGYAWAADFRPLVGRWQRIDGGYVIDIRQVSTDGKLSADYYNPRPINISSARASVFKGYFKVEVELRDTGYPGSTYTLLYDPKKDALLGIYYQAVQGQTFDVVFVRRQ